MATEERGTTAIKITDNVGDLGVSLYSKREFCTSHCIKNVAK